MGVYLSKLQSALHHHFLGLGDCLRRIQPFRTNLCTIHDGVAAIQLERIFKLIQSLSRRVIATVYQPAVGGE